MLSGSDAAAGRFSPCRVIFDSFGARTRLKEGVGCGLRSYDMGVDAAGARVLAERLAETRPRPAARVSEEPVRSGRFPGGWRKRPRARIEEWIDAQLVANVVEEPVVTPGVWIGSPPVAAPAERWLFYERGRERVVDGRRVTVVESVCTKVLPSGAETTVVARRFVN
jgi:hypothetical protein